MFENSTNLGIHDLFLQYFISNCKKKKKERKKKEKKKKERKKKKHLFKFYILVNIQVLLKVTIFNLY